MRKPFAAPAVLLASLVCPIASAQSVESVLVAKGSWFVQRGPTTVQPSTHSLETNRPFEFWCTVGGTEMPLLSPPPRVAGPFASIVNKGIMGLNPIEQEEWQYGPPLFDNFADTQSELDAGYPDGTYTVTVDGVEIPLTLGGTLYPSPPPVMTLSGGWWAADGRYEIPADRTLSITTSQFPAYGTHVLDAILLEAYVPGGEFVGTLQFSWDNPANTASLNVPAGTFSPGNYRIDAGFIACSQAGLAAPEFPNALAAAFYESGTRILLRVLPPSPPDPWVYWFDMGKVRWYRQINGTTVQPLGPEELPFEFWANAGGSSMGPTPRVTGPITNPEPGHNGGFLGFGPGAVWRYGAPNFEGWWVGTQSELDALFGNGLYTFTGAGVTRNVVLSGNLYPTSAPRVLVPGGTWIAPGVCLVSTGGFTLTTTNHPQWGNPNAVDQEILLTVEGEEFFAEELALASEQTQPSLSMAIPPGSLTPGAEYMVSAEFFALTTALGESRTWYALASYGKSTEFTIRVRVPADLNGDGIVSSADLAILLGSWGPCGSCAADLNGDGEVSSPDLALLLGAWS